MNTKQWLFDIFQRKKKKKRCWRGSNVWNNVSVMCLLSLALVTSFSNQIFFFMWREICLSGFSEWKWVNWHGLLPIQFKKPNQIFCIIRNQRAFISVYNCDFSSHEKVPSIYFLFLGQTHILAFKCSFEAERALYYGDRFSIQSTCMWKKKEVFLRKHFNFSIPRVKFRKVEVSSTSILYRFSLTSLIIFRWR